jgi:hypothetical protein
METALPHIALVSTFDALALDEDLPPLQEALVREGAQVSTPCWDDATVDWSSFNLAVLRSTWNYVERIDEFRAWVRRCAAQTRLFNPPALLEWNTDKHYLQHLHRAGVAVVPTRARTHRQPCSSSWPAARTRSRSVATATLTSSW